MKPTTSYEKTKSFSLHETIKPKIQDSQIRLNERRKVIVTGIPKPDHKLVVRRSGKIGFSK